MHPFMFGFRLFNYYWYCVGTAIEDHDNADNGDVNRIVRKE